MVPSEDRIFLDVPEEHVPKPQAVVPPMHSETSPVSNDDNRGLVPGSKLFHISIRDPRPTKFVRDFHFLFGTDWF